MKTTSKDNIIISVVCIGYNIENYVEQCIKSIIEQSINVPYEVLFVDDGSTDNTSSIVERYSDRVKLIKKENGGIISARKRGLLEAKGEYIFFVDGDDWLNVDCLKNLYSEIENNSNGKVDIVCSDFYFQKNDGAFDIIKVSQKQLEKCKNYEFFEGIMKDEIEHRVFPKLYKRELLIDAGYENFLEITMAEDLLTNSMVGIRKPNVVFSKTVNYFYRCNFDSVLRKGGEKLLEQIKTLDWLDEHLKQYKHNIKNIDELVCYQCFLYMHYYAFTYTKSSVKRKIINNYKKRGYTLHSNEYVEKKIDSFNKRFNYQFFIRYYFPYFIGIFESCLKIFKGIKSVKNRLHKLKMDRYYYKKVKKIPNDNNSKLVLMGTSDRSNIGDHAIALSEKRFLDKEFSNYKTVEITGDEYRSQRERIQNKIGIEDVLFITGGGFLGDLWPDEENMVEDIINTYSDNRIIIFPQTVFYYDEKDSSYLRSKIRVFRNHPNLFIIARDKKTFEFFSRYLPSEKIKLYPDMALYLEEKMIAEPSNKSVFVCLRKDKEKVVSDEQNNRWIKKITQEGYDVEETTTFAVGKYYGDIQIENRYSEISKKLQEFSKADFIITDRLHGMILSTLAGTPCIALDNLSKKVGGVYKQWLTNIDSIFYLEDTKDFESAYNIIKNKKHFQYDADYLDDKKCELIKYINAIIGE